MDRYKPKFKFQGSVCVDALSAVLSAYEEINP